MITHTYQLPIRIINLKAYSQIIYKVQFVNRVRIVHRYTTNIHKALNMPICYCDRVSAYTRKIELNVNGKVESVEI